MSNKTTITEKAIKEYAESLGYWPSQTQWNKYASQHGHLSYTGLYYHTKTNWERYRQKFDFPSREKVFSRAECIEALKNAAKKLGLFFTRKEYGEWQKNKSDLPSIGQISGRCGGWNKAKEDAGLFSNTAWGI